MDALRRHLPEGTTAYVAALLSDGTLREAGVEVRVVRSRRSKLGDHRGPSAGGAGHRITVNDDLNPYAFLTTLLHEIAHAVTWERHQRSRARFARSVLPHGPQWKEEFGRILAPVVADGRLPGDVSRALAEYLANPRAATCSDRGLVVALARYDAPDPARVRVEEVPAGGTFRIEGGRTFLKGPRLRTRYRCFDARSGAEYRIHALCRVEPCPWPGPSRASALRRTGSRSGSPAASVPAPFAHGGTGE